MHFSRETVCFIYKHLEKSNKLEFLPIYTRPIYYEITMKHFEQTQNTNVTRRMCSEKFAVYGGFEAEEESEEDHHFFSQWTCSSWMK